jgi:uncharacterized protein YecT (DUF1311 family)
MTRLLLFLLVLAPALHAQDDCPYFGEKAANDLATALEKASSCSAGVDKLHRCMWGSSADARFASVVISKCEQTFLDKLSPPAHERYLEEIELCGYRESRAEGTIHISEGALCAVDVAADYATYHPEKRNDQPLRASFNCAAARSPLELAICSHIPLGHADIVLSRAYTGVLRTIPPKDRPALIQNQKDWLAMVPRKCGITTSSASNDSIDCARSEFELRFSTLDGCVPYERDSQKYILPCILDSAKSW